MLPLKMATPVSKMVRLPEPDTAAWRRQASLVGRPGKPFGSWDSFSEAGLAELDVVVLAAFSLSNVSGKPKMMSAAAKTPIPTLTYKATAGVPPWPSRFISQPEMGGQTIAAAYCIDDVMKKSAARSLADGTTSA
jgi:hypothetical protein